MNRLVRAAFFAMMLSMASCGYSPARVDAISERLVSDDKGTGFVDAYGNILYDNRFEGRVSAIVGGYFSVETAEGVTVYRAMSQPEQLGDLTRLRAAGLMSEGLIPVFRANGRLEAVDGFGVVRMSVPVISGRKVTLASAMFRCGLLSIGYEKDGRRYWGAVDHDGQRIISPVYASELVFSEGVARAIRLSKGGYRTLIISTDGTTLCEVPDDVSLTSEVMHNGRFSFVAGSRCGLLDREGNRTMFPAEVKAIEDFDDTYIIYVDSAGRFGLMDRKGRVKLRARYERLSFGHRGQLLAAGQGGHLMLIDYNGNVIARFDGASWAVYIGSSKKLGLKSDFDYEVMDADDTAQLYDASGSPVGNEWFTRLGYEDVVFAADPIFGGEKVKEPVTPEVPVDSLRSEFVADSLIGEKGKELVESSPIVK